MDNIYTSNAMMVQKLPITRRCNISDTTYLQPLDSTFDSQGIFSTSIAILDSSTAIICYADTFNQNTPHALVVNVDNDNNITIVAGPIQVTTTGVDEFSRGRKLSSTKAVFGGNYGTEDYVQIFVLEYSGGSLRLASNKLVIGSFSLHTMYADLMVLENGDILYYGRWTGDLTHFHYISYINEILTEEWSDSNDNYGGSIREVWQVPQTNKLFAFGFNSSAIRFMSLDIDIPSQTITVDNYNDLDPTIYGGNYNFTLLGPFEESNDTDVNFYYKDFVIYYGERNYNGALPNANYPTAFVVRIQRVLYEDYYYATFDTNFSTVGPLTDNDSNYEGHIADGYSCNNNFLFGFHRYNNEVHVYRLNYITGAVPKVYKSGDEVLANRDITLRTAEALDSNRALLVGSDENEVTTLAIILLPGA